jgi:LysM repeat protein
VNVTVAQVRRANGLTAKSTLKTGQKLFIPKPGA